MKTMFEHPSVEKWLSRVRSGDVRFELIEATTTYAGIMPRGETGFVTWDSGRSLTVVFPSGCSLKAIFNSDESGLVVGELRVVACELDSPFVILLRIQLNNSRQPYFMIPAVLYGTNNAMRGVVADHPIQFGYDPKLGYRSASVQRDRTMSPGWHVRADRSANPSVIAIDDGRCVAAGIRETSVNPSGDWLYNSLGVWTTARDGDSISVAIGAFDWPGRFDKHQLLEQPAFEPLERLYAVGMTTEIYLYDGAASDRFAYEDFIVRLAGHLHEPPREGAHLRTAMRDVADPLINDGIDPQTGYFHMFRDANGISHAGSLLAYAGLLQIARPLIQCGRLLDETRYVHIASEMTDRAVADAFNSESGLFFDMIQEGRWQPNTWWPALEHTALVNGHACYLLLKMYEESGSIHWAEAARRVLEQAVLHQRGDGRFPSGFAAKDGRPITYTGIAGSYFVAPLLIAYRLFGDIHFGTAALKALEHYWYEFSRLEWIGVELDCGGAVDSTSSYALSRALVELHRNDPTSATLQRLHHVIHYACTFHFAHNTRHRHAACDWSSSGAKITSTHNIHIDAYAGLFLEDIDYYLAKADDPYFRMRLDDATAWARQAYNRNEAEYGWGKFGWVAEQFNHTFVAYFNDHGDGTIWNAYFPWVSGALLAANVIEWKHSIMGEMKGGANECKPIRVG